MTVWMRARGVAAAAATAAVVSSLVQLAAQAPSVRATPVQGAVTLLSGAGGNVVVQSGVNGLVIVDSGDGTANDALIAAIHAVSSGPIQYILNTGPQAEHVAGNAALRSAGQTFTGGNALAVAGVGVGASIIAHERLLARVSGAGAGGSRLPQAGWPTDTFYVRKMDLFVNDEPIELLHAPQSITDGNVVVHFRKSDVLAVGDIIRFDHYPAVEASAGGTMAGTIAAINALIDVTVPKILQEGGTLVVPGHGRIGDESDLVEYRDMLTIIRDRVADMVKDGKTVAEVRAARVSRDYDVRYAAASGPASADGLAELLYRELAASRGATARR